MRKFSLFFAAVLILAASFAIRSARTATNEDSFQQALLNDPYFKEGNFRSRFIASHIVKPGLLVVRAQFQVGAQTEPNDEERAFVVEVIPFGDVVPVVHEELDSISIPAGNTHIRHDIVRGYELPPGRYRVYMYSYIPAENFTDDKGNVSISRCSSDSQVITVP